MELYLSNEVHNVESPVHRATSLFQPGLAQFPATREKSPTAWMWNEVDPPTVFLGRTLVVVRRRRETESNKFPTFCEARLDDEQVKVSVIRGPHGRCVKDIRRSCKVRRRSKVPILAS